MKAHVRIDVACNDPDNGRFAGKTMMIQIGDAELEADDWNGYRFTELGGAIRLHRRKFIIESSKEWIGNWCWNGYVMPRAEAKRLISVLRDSGRWRCTSGPCRWYDWFNRQGRYEKS